MSEEFLKNPLSLFDIRGKTAIVTGASGAFGALAAKTARPRSHFTKSFECHDGTPRPVVKTQNSSLHLMTVEGS